MKKNRKLSALIANGKTTAKVFGPEFKLGVGLGLIFAGFVGAIKATKNPAEEIAEAEQELIYTLLDEQCRAYFGKGCEELLEEARIAMEADLSDQ